MLLQVLLMMLQSIHSVSAHINIPCIAYNPLTPPCPEHFNHAATCRYVNCHLMQEPMVPIGYKVLLGANETYTLVKSTHAASNATVTFLSENKAYVNHLFVDWPTTPVYVAHVSHANGSVTYALETPNDMFTMNTTTGAVSMNHMPVHDVQHAYSFTVRATDEAGNDAALQVSLSVCPPFHTASTKCLHNELPNIRQQQVTARIQGHYINSDINGEIHVVSTETNVKCSDAESDQFELYLAQIMYVPPEDVILVDCKVDSATGALVLTSTIATHADHEHINKITRDLQNKHIMKRVVAAATGLSFLRLHVLATSGAVMSHPSSRANYYHQRYRRVSDIYRMLSFPITPNLDMKGVGTTSGALVISADTPPMLVHVSHLPTPGVTGCKPLLSFYTHVRDRLVDTLPYAVKQFEINTGNQVQLETLRRDIEIAQKDVHSVQVFCGDLAQVLKVRRNVFHAYTSAWADMKFGDGTLPRTRKKKHGSLFNVHSNPSSHFRKSKHSRESTHKNWNTGESETNVLSRNSKRHWDVPGMSSTLSDKPKRHWEVPKPPPAKHWDVPGMPSTLSDKPKRHWEVPKPPPAKHWDVPGMPSTLSDKPKRHWEVPKPPPAKHWDVPGIDSSAVLSPERSKHTWQRTSPSIPSWKAPAPGSSTLRKERNHEQEANAKPSVPSWKSASHTKRGRWKEPTSLVTYRHNASSIVAKTRTRRHSWKSHSSHNIFHSHESKEYPKWRRLIQSQRTNLEDDNMLQHKDILNYALKIAEHEPNVILELLRDF